MEDDFRNSEFDADSILSSIENDPFDIQHEDPHKKREMEKFLKSQEAMGINMAVTMFMVDALRYFEGMNKEKIKKIALEIAMQGTQGFNPEKKGYTIGSIPGKSFSGYHILAYYYVSWALVIPEMLKELNLPYDDEYKMALKLHEENEK